MEIVKIPENANPWRCIVNGVLYEYAAGETATVPDDVAAVVRAYYAGQERQREEEPREKVAKDAESEIPFALGMDAGGLYFTTSGEEKAKRYVGEWKIETYKDIKLAIRKGKASEYFYVGDQVTTPYLAADGKTYQAPWDVKHIDDTGVYFGMHYAIPEAMQFDAPEAIYYAADGLTAGTYHINVGTAYGNGWKNGSSIQFALAKPVPAGGQVYIDCGANNEIDPAAGRTVTTYAAIGAAEAIETTTTSGGTEGTSLGTVGAGNTPYKTSGNLNTISRAVYGSGRYSESAIRQWLNSEAGPNMWWAPKNNWDRPPTASSLAMAGFLSRLPQEFVAILDYTDIPVALNTAEGIDADREIVHDRIFPPSIQNLHVVPQLADAEAPDWDYYKALAEQAGLPDKFQQRQAYSILRHYNLASVSGSLAPVYVWLRSAYRYSADAWLINSSGYVGTNAAVIAYRCCPACKIKKSE